MSATLEECLQADLLMQAIYTSKGGGAGCCWHVVLDDYNYDSVDWVINEWLPKTECQKQECRDIAPLLKKMSMTQRKKLCRGGYSNLHEVKSQ